MQIKHVLSFVQIHPLLCIEYRHTFPLFENCRVFWSIWGKITWLFVTYGMFQKTFFQQSSQLLADTAVFSLFQIGDSVSSLPFSENFAIIHKYINLTLVHAIALYLLFKENC